MFKMSSYYISKKTFPRQCLTVKGIPYKEFEWVQIEGVPCALIQNEVDENGIIQAATLNSFTSDPDKHFKVTGAELEEQFTPAILSRDGYIQSLTKYPDGKLHTSEFQKRVDVKNLAALFSKIPNEDLQSKLKQTLVSQGSTHAITIPAYHDYINGTKKLKSTENFGDPIFNRSKRWCPPIDISFEEFKASPSYPAPLGVRPKDFCLPSEIILSCTELIQQMASFANSDPTFVEAVTKNILATYNIAPLPTAFCCKWCSKEIDANKCKSEYKSSTNYIEICHRDPNDRFLPRNVYWGHGDCNRRQGGYTERDRIEDAITLLKNNPEYLALYKHEFSQLI